MSRMFLPNTHTNEEPLDGVDTDHVGRSSYQLMVRAGFIRQVSKDYRSKKFHRLCG